MKSKRRCEVRCVGTGFVALDIIRSTLDSNTVIERRHAGGSCGNVLAVLSYLGVRASVVGRIGSDSAATELLNDLRRWKLDTTLLVAEEDRRTPMVIQETYIDARGKARHRFSRACPACGAIMAGYRPLLTTDVDRIASKLPEHGLFFFDRVSAGTLELARKSRAQGAFVLFEPSGIKDEKLFVECVRASHVLKYSQERLSDLDALLRNLRLPLEIETLGARGLRYRSRTLGSASAWHLLPAFPAVSIRDSAGSGDWCTAGFMARIAATRENPVARLDKLDVIKECLRFGQALAALNCSYDGARGLMYSVAKTDALAATEQLLSKDVPILPACRVASRDGGHAPGTCAVCATVMPAKVVANVRARPASRLSRLATTS